MKTKILFTYGLFVLAGYFTLSEEAHAKSPPENCVLLTVVFLDKDPSHPDAAPLNPDWDAEVNYVECGGSITTGYARRHVANSFKLQPNQNVKIGVENTVKYFIDENIPNRQFPGDHTKVECWGSKGYWSYGETAGCRLVKG